MPELYWMPKKKTLLEDIALEEARKNAINQSISEMKQPQALPQRPWEPAAEKVFEPPARIKPLGEPPQRIFKMPEVAPKPQPTVKAPEPKKEPVSVPLWQRAIQVFTAPFEWVDENIIKPGLGLAATTSGLLPEVARKPGEDFWEWKKRSWAGWESPGFDVKVPWGDGTARIDLRGILEIAPWLLIPGAGQVGGGVRAARGVAGILGKAGKIGRVAGKAVEYSPWGLVEKTAGVAIKGGFRAVGKVSERVSTALGEKMFGKYVPPPVPPAVKKLTDFIVKTERPTYKKFRKEMPKLRSRQEVKAKGVQEKYLRGEIPLKDLTRAELRALKGGIREEFALTPEKMAERQAKAISEVEVRVAAGTISKSSGKALITKIKNDPIYTPVFTRKQIPPPEGMRVGEKLYHGTRAKNLSTFVDKEGNLILRSGRQTEDYLGRTLDEPFPAVAFTASQKAARSFGREAIFEIEPSVLQKMGLSRGDIGEYIISTQKAIKIPKGSWRIAEGTDELMSKLPKEMRELTITPEATIVPLFTDAEVKTLNDMIVDGVESGLVTHKSGRAFRDLLMVTEGPTAGGLLTPAIIRDWSKVFGFEFARAVGALKGSGKGVSQLIDALNLPRAFLASLDLSATLRQGLILGLLHPTMVPRWFGRQVKAFFSEKLALEADDMLRARPLYKSFIKDGGYIAPLREALPTKAEELFMSDLARRIPGVRRSERAFITYLNQARMTAYEAAHGAMTAQGATPQQFKILADFINMASGRGTLPKSLEKYTPAINTILFSPRLQAATLQLPRQLGRMLLSKNPYMRKEAAKAFIAFVGGGAAILGLLKGTGNKVELDPRAGDFGKVIIGETRLDIWRGYLQYTRFFAQMLTEERKSAYGNMNKAERGEIASRFLQSKSSPAFGLMVDLLRGENYQGEPIFDDTTGFTRTAMERVLPLALQDVIDSMEMNGANGMWVAAPAGLGVGALTYVNDYVRVKERIANEMGYESWDDIDPKTQREIQNRNAEFQAASIAFDRQVMGTAWGDWRSAGNAIEEGFRENVDFATAKYQKTQDGVQYREDISDAFTARRGAYDAREREERFEDIVARLNIDDSAESMVALGPEQTAIKIYNDALFGDDMYDEFNDYRFDEAERRKAELRLQLGSDMIDYIEEYRGLKFENFPSEFQGLMKAKQVLRPYWQVKSEVEKIFGKPTNPYQEKRVNSLIRKIRDRMKRQWAISNPEALMLYEKFYTQG